MILGIFDNPLKWLFLGVVFKRVMRSASFRDCITLRQGVPKIFRLNFEEASNGFDGQFFSEFVLCKRISMEDLVSAKVRIDNIVIES
jgi:hypothetical protein